MVRRRAVTINDLQARARERKSAHVNSGQSTLPLPLDEAVNEQNDCRQGNFISMTRGQGITADPSYPQRSNDKAVNEQHVDPPAMFTDQRSENHVPMENGRDSLGTDQQRCQNIDDELRDQHVDPQAITRGKRSERIANYNQRREQSIFDADQQVGGNTNESADEQHDDHQDEVFEQHKARGYTYMPRLWAISSKHSNIQPLKVEFNKYGKPIGPNKSNYVEFLGSIARNGNLAPLSYKDWHKVPKSFKKDMLDKVKGSFVVPVGYDKFVLQALSKSWRNFKCRIKANYFNPKATIEQNLRRRPDKHDERVKHDQWKVLVEYWCSEETKKTSEKNKEHRARKKMQHTTGKRSFAQVYEMAKEEALRSVGIAQNDVDGDENVEESGISQLTRAEIFLKCYSRDGNTSNPEVANALEKMKQLKSQLPPGARDEGPNDIYSQVLGEDKFILWKKARLDKKCIYEDNDLADPVYKTDDYIQETEGVLKSKGPTEDSTTIGPAKHGEHEITPKMLFKCSSGRMSIEQDIKEEKKEETRELKKTISEQGERIEKLESVVSKLLGKDIQIDEKGSSLEKSQCPTNEDENSFSKDENSDDDDDVQLIDKAESLEGKLVELILDSSNTVVAYGTIVAMYKPGSKLHGAPFPENCMRVSIDEAVDEYAPLPIPILGECENISEAVGNHVAWPEHLIMKQNKKPKKKTNGQEKKLKVSTSMPTSLKMLYCYSKLALEDGGSISMRLDDDLFDEECELYVHLEDIIPFCQLEPITCNCIVVYIWHLYQKLKEENKLDKFRFVNPHSIPHEPTKKMEKDWIVERLNKKARVLADRLIGTIRNQLVLVPCNIGFHWILSVIDPYKEVVFLLDPLGLCTRDLDWKYVVDTAFKFFNKDKRRKGKKQPTWKIVSGPRQPDETQCGFYVLRYMRQVIEEVATIREDSLQSIFTKDEYSQKEIDEVRSEWAERIQEHICE